VVVDSTNPLNATFGGLTTVGTSVPGGRVVKAFNTIFAARRADPSQDGRPIDGFYAGDDDAAEAAVAELLASLGYRPIDAGPLRMARTLEEKALLNITLQVRNGWPWQSAYALVGSTG
jgi:predicted dinucleotide-binding enzyme